MRALKTIGIAVFVAAVTAGSVVWYIDYKINQMTEAVMAPIHETTERVNETVADIENGVDSAVGTAGSIYERARDSVALDVEEARADLEEEWANMKTISGSVGDWLTSIGT